MPSDLLNVEKDATEARDIAKNHNVQVVQDFHGDSRDFGSHPGTDMTPRTYRKVR